MINKNQDPGSSMGEFQNLEASLKKSLVLWRGYHQRDLLYWIEKAWNQRIVLIIVPPLVRDFGFLQKWKGEVFHQGEWPEDIKGLTIKKLKPLESKAENFLPEESKLINVGKEKSFHWPSESFLGLFTSGTSSGIPSLVLFSQSNIQCALNSLRSLFDESRIEKIFCYPQPSHVFGMVLGYFHSFLYETPLVFSEKPYSREAHELWLKEVNGGTLTLGTPTHFMDLISWCKTQKVTIPKSYSCVIGGAPVTQKLWKQIQSELKIESPSIGYGATEATLGVSHLSPGVEPEVDSSIGKLLPHIEMVHHDLEGFTFKGPSVPVAQWKNNEFVPFEMVVLNDIIKPVGSEKIVANHLENNQNQTDLNKKDFNHRYYLFEGRSDLVINRGGLKISPEILELEIENATPLKVLAIGFPEVRLGQDIALIVEGLNSTTKNINDSELIPDLLMEFPVEVKLIQRILSQRFGFNINSKNIISNSLPRTENGKKDRVEALKILIQFLKNPKEAIPISFLKPFLPHRSSAIWIDRIHFFEPMKGESEVDLKAHSNYWIFEKGQRQLSCSSTIEWVAQTYGYSRVANEIYGYQKKLFAHKTLIAEVKSLENCKPQIWSQLEPGETLSVKARCTHDFNSLFIIEGEVYRKSFEKEGPLSKVNLKIYAGN